MDAQQIRGLQPMLARFLKRFDDCFARKDTRGHLSVYVNGQLSDLGRKSVEPIALAANVPVRTLQEFLSQHRWQEDLARDRLQSIVAEEHAHPHSVGIVDETSFVKRGKKTPGVQRQYLGTVGKQENGIVTVHLAYAADDFHCLLDGELFLPESWAADPARCQEAKIPADMTYRPKMEKGPLIWEVKHVPFYLQGPDGLPGPRWHLVVARNVLDPAEMKFFVSNASPDVSVGTILLAAFSRWRVERCFEDGKGEVGLDHCEGRRYPGLERHLILSAISYLFLAATNQRMRGEKIRVDCLPGPHRRLRTDSLVVDERAGVGATVGTHRPRHPAGATPRRLRSPLPHQANSPSFAEHGHQVDGNSRM